MKKKKIKADDQFVAGNVQFARFGRFVRMKNVGDQASNEKWKRDLVRRLPRIEQKVTGHFSKAIKIIEGHSPLALLHRAYWEMVGQNTVEPDKSSDEEASILSIQLLEFIQNVVAASKEIAPEPPELDDESWRELTENFESGLNALIREFQLADLISRTDSLNEGEAGREHFRSQAMVHWTMVKGERYSYHEKQNLEDLLLGQDDVLNDALGVTSRTLVDGVWSIHQALTEGVFQACQELKDIEEMCAPLLQEKIEQLNEEISTEDCMQNMFLEVVEEQGLTKRHEKAVSEFIGVGLFDVQQISEIPKSVLFKMSWELGEEVHFLAQGKKRGWPSKTTPISIRPFLKIEDRVYCFSVHGLFDHVYRAIQRLVSGAGSEFGERWRVNQEQITEGLPVKYFEKLLPGCTVHTNVYYRWYPKVGHEKREWCELDSIVAFGDHLFLVEVKARAFSPRSPDDDFGSYLNSIERLALEPARQGNRFYDYLKSSESVELYDKAQKGIGRIKSGDYRHVTVCAVSIDPFTEITASLRKLSKFGLGDGSSLPVWAISLDDLRVCSDVFQNPLVFLHFIEKRMAAARSEHMELDDELDHVGLYFKVNDYALHHEELRESLDSEVQFTGYRKDIDEYFNALHLGEAQPSPFEQKLPLILRQVLDFCLEKANEKYVSLTSFLLDGAEEFRVQISDGVEVALTRQEQRRKIQLLATTGSVRLSIACWQPWLFPPDPDFLADHAKAEMILHKEKDRHILGIHFDQDRRIVDLDWSSVFSDEIGQESLPKYQSLAAAMRSRRLLATQGSQQVGRNSPCPCGSGMKFKKCCL